MPFTSPFGTSTSAPGYGTIILDVLPPNMPVLRTMSYQYPLKLVSPDPLPSPSSSLTATTSCTIHTVFLLTYGGGIVAGDSIHLNVELKPRTRLILLTQGSTKIFNTPHMDLKSRQRMSVQIKSDAALLYLPDPVQPFAQTAFVQSQTYHLENERSNLCVCDWVTSGRSARGECWDIYEYRSKNEVWTETAPGMKKLLLRDNLILDKRGRTDMSLSSRMDGYTVFGTLIIQGPLFSSLARFFLDEFEALPRVGGRNWDDNITVKPSFGEQQRAARLAHEETDGLIWSAASVRGFVLVKFSSRHVEGSRNWLRNMIKAEGSVLQTFGERAILCLK